MKIIQIAYLYKYSSDYFMLYRILALHLIKQISFYA